MQKILFIDGRNFLSKLNLILNPENKKEIDFSRYNFSNLFTKVLTNIQLNRKIFYFGKLVRHQKTAQKSDALIAKQRALKTSLEFQGFKFVSAGRVRGHLEKCPLGHEMLIFKEKGVDVKLSVDMVRMAHKKELETAIIASSDSDLQPAISELKELRVACVYLGFEHSPNKGLLYTASSAILIRDSEVFEFASF